MILTNEASCLMHSTVKRFFDQLNLHIPVYERMFFNMVYFPTDRMFHKCDVEVKAYDHDWTKKLEKPT